MKMAKAKKVAVFVLAHRDNSRKSRVHVAFDKNGAEKAFAYGKKLGLRETTLRSWFSQFRKVAASRKANGKAHAKALAA